jgi:predicted SprT family Zn-dependent metalloprotease
MEIGEALALGAQLLRVHGLDDWRVGVDRAKTRAGVCRFDVREIALSGPLTRLLSPGEVRETLLHEIAHALVGPAHQHDAVWREQAARLGCAPQASMPSDAPRLVAPWVGTCPAGHTVQRHRRPQRPASCSQCSRTYDPRHQLRWQFRAST